MSKIHLSARLLGPGLSLALIACSGSPASSNGSGIHVVATTGMVADAARNVLGGHGRVEALMGAGVDPHLYKASESDVRRLADADLILHNGLHLEGKMGEILEKIAESRPVVAVSDVLPRAELREPPAGLATQYDPHIWFDVELWSRTLPPVVAALSKLDPAHAAEFEQNAETYRQQLLELDRWVGGRIAEIPAERRVLVTAHDAFGYFGRRYRIEVLGLQGISTVTEAGLADLERVVGVVTQRKVKAVFVESSVPRRSIEAVQAAAGEHIDTWFEARL
nr:zinc ABC transporter substrate-binding protein [Thermoanaerobaculia bacterium]